MPMLIAPSANPFSAGSFPLGRIFTLGDRAVLRQSDMMTGIEEETRNARVTRVDLDEDRVEFNQGKMITDLMGNPIKQGQAEYETPVQWTPAVLQVGRKWTAAFRLSKDGESSNAYYDLHITRRETISVPAGNFDTFRIEGTGWNTTFGSSFELVQWVVPGVNFTIKREFTIRSKNGRIRKSRKAGTGRHAPAGLRSGRMRRRGRQLLSASSLVPCENAVASTFTGHRIDHARCLG